MVYSQKKIDMFLERDPTKLGYFKIIDICLSEADTYRKESIRLKAPLVLNALKLLKEANQKFEEDMHTNDIIKILESYKTVIAILEESEATKSLCIEAKKQFEDYTSQLRFKRPDLLTKYIHHSNFRRIIDHKRNKDEKYSITLVDLVNS